VPIASALLDPTFWQALERAGALDKKRRAVNGDQPTWLHQRHRLVDHLAEGKSLEAFFATA
jgi:hypothetical protein